MLTTRPVPSSGWTPSLTWPCLLLALVLLAPGCGAGGESGEEVAVEEVTMEEVEVTTAAGDPSASGAPQGHEMGHASEVPDDAVPLRLPSGDDVHGVDVSHHSGEVDWQQVVDAGYSFAYLKATEGVDALDPTFADHWLRLREMGVPRGAYHFYVTEDDPEAQARFFLDTVDWRPGDLRPVVDVELIGHGTQDGWPEDLRRFVEIVEAEVGVPPIVYTMPNFWDANLGGGFDDLPLWVAEYGVSEPRLPKAWQSWQLWQHGGDQAVPGVEKGADVSRLHPDADFRDLMIDPAAVDGEAPTGGEAPARPDR